MFISPLTFIFYWEQGKLKLTCLPCPDSALSILHLDCFKSFLTRFFAHMIWPLLLYCFIFLKQGSDHVTLINKIIHCLFTSINKTPEQSLPQSVHLALYCICTLLFSSPFALCSWKPKFLICCQESCNFHQNEKAIAPYPHSWLDFFLSIIHLVNTKYFWSRTSFKCLLWGTFADLLEQTLMCPSFQILFQQVSVSHNYLVT